MYIFIPSTSSDKLSFIILIYSIICRRIIINDMHVTRNSLYRIIRCRSILYFHRLLGRGRTFDEFIIAVFRVSHPEMMVDGMSWMLHTDDAIWLDFSTINCFAGEEGRRRCWLSIRQSIEGISHARWRGILMSFIILICFECPFFRAKWKSGTCVCWQECTKVVVNSLISRHKVTLDWCHLHAHFHFMRWALLYSPALSAAP